MFLICWEYFISVCIVFRESAGPLFLIFMRELNASILLFSSLLFSEKNEVMSVILFLLLEDAPAPQIAAYSMIQVVLLLGIVYLVRRFTDAGDTAAA